MPRTLTHVFAAVLAPIVLLCVMEEGLRLFNVGYPNGLTVPCTVGNRPAACFNLFFPAPFFPPGVIRTPQLYSIPAEKPEGTFRIFVLGESAAMGDPDPAYAFSRYLEVMLRERYPAMKFEVVNTGSAAINSHVSLPIAEGLATQRPDVIIIYSGNNEVVGPYGPGTALVGSAMSMPVIRSSIYLRSTRIGQLVTKLGAQKQEWKGMEMFLGKQVPASSPTMKYVYANFEQNLRDTVRVARSSGARVIVSTVAINLKDCSPFASAHRELREDELRSWTEFVERGDQLKSQQSYTEALNAYESALKIDGQYAELEFRIAQTFWTLGDYARAKQHYSRARDLDTLRFRADARINEINRSVASSTGAELVDAEQILSDASPHGITDSALVYEHVHMTPTGNYLLARAMFMQIASKIPSDSGASVQEVGVPSQDECDRLLALTKHDRIRITNEVLQRLQRPPFTNQTNHSEQLLRLMLKASEPDESPAETVAGYQWAIAQNPNDALLHYNYGLFLFPFNRLAAAQQLRMARPWDGFPMFGPDGQLIP